MVKKYTKKPVTIEAVQWTGFNLSDVKQFCGDSINVTYYDSAWRAGAGAAVAVLKIETLEGEMTVSKGDYIIKGVKDEFYPCKPDIFHETYIEAESEDAE